jgi:hypothetical protein
MPTDDSNSVPFPGFHHPETLLLSLWKVSDRPDILSHLSSFKGDLISSSNLRCKSCTHLIQSILRDHDIEELCLSARDRTLPHMHAKSNEVWMPCSLPAFLPSKFAKSAFIEATKDLQDRWGTVSHGNQKLAKLDGLKVEDMVLVTRKGELEEFRKRERRLAEEGDALGPSKNPESCS